jgi:two-component system, OmpR family, response regulator VicR
MVTMSDKKIIYIEDDSELANLVRLILQKEGYQVMVAFDGQHGLDLIRNEQPDLILLDIMVPFLDGWEVYKRLQGDEQLRDIPVIVITAKSQTIDRVLGLHIAKVDDYICKPFHPEEIVSSVKKIFSLDKMKQ